MEKELCKDYVNCLSLGNNLNQVSAWGDRKLRTTAYLLTESKILTKRPFPKISQK